jgi:hypothetical protein
MSSIDTPLRSYCIKQPIQPKQGTTKQSWKTINFKESGTMIKEKMINLDKPISSSLDLYNEPLSSSDLPDGAMPFLPKPARLKLDGQSSNARFAMECVAATKSTTQEQI